MSSSVAMLDDEASGGNANVLREAMKWRPQRVGSVAVRGDGSVSERI